MENAIKTQTLQNGGQKQDGGAQASQVAVVTPVAGTPVQGEASLPVLGAASETELGAAYVQALVEAEVKARTAVALQRPRDWDAVRQKLLKEVSRPGLAEQAEYKIPRGGTEITGPSIRFAEAAIRAMGNLAVSVRVTEDGKAMRKGEVVVCDLESNTTYSAAWVIDKTMERRKLPAGVTADDIVATRKASDGGTVYVLKAPETEVQLKQGAVVSRVLRGLALRLLPGDLLEEALDLARQVRTGALQAQDPEAVRKKIADSFASLGVTVEMLAEYLGHPLSQTTPAEIDDLRKLYVAIRDGATTWAEAIEAVRGTRQAKVQAAVPDAVKEAMTNGKKKTKPSPAGAGGSEAVVGGEGSPQGGGAGGEVVH
jgi:hypothetical protein